MNDSCILNAIVVKGVSILELRALEQKPLLIRWSAFRILNIFLQFLDRLIISDIKIHSFSGQRLDCNKVSTIWEDIWFTYEHMVATIQIFSNQIISTKLCRGGFIRI